MSCSHGKSECVCDTVREIVRAQDAVEDNCCDSSCEQSINDLLSPTGGNGTATTVPFTLLCKGTCEYFIGKAIAEKPLGGSGGTFLDCLESPIFRAKNFVDEDECCVRLELLLPVTEGSSEPGSKKDICDFFPGSSVRDLEATGVCFTVDLNCFCGIQCLPATTPLAPTVSSEKDS
ncbi:CotY/CotZ family spore coat protein [Pontibacillus marinus]|uniref:Spore coat protein n=1 Tax=Pontibacillus marinus BH030004 = DSM 16465 TaxID=1385511 RepID=A0A0A5GEK4_9BACI|nr:CotY/CotZ family spore coat protein [Pontibacillus marinus]KGX89540.1 spore coat protein [Pontibacillus marinus BH030004 = DSM 16465]